jgi:hypothetical protein
MAEHGTQAKYVAGCRCGRCRVAHRNYMADYRRRRAAAGGGRVNVDRNGASLNGYVRRQTDGKRMLEHRRIMEELIGRPLRPGETVHHKNGNHSDNRASNLDLRVSGLHPSGQRAEDLVTWAREILAEYGPVVERLP